MNVVAVVLNWRRPAETIACVAALRALAPEVEPLVVDNGSGDDSVARLRAALPDVRLIEHGRNDGYAGGNNVGIAAALNTGAGAVLVLNNDVVVRPGCVEALVAALEAHPEWGIVAPLSLLADDPSVVDFFTASVDLANLAVVAHGRDERRAFAEEAETDYATGSAMLVRREVFDRIGMFDERFFLVWEDVDFCLRARAAGFRIGVTPVAEVLHGRSVTFGGDGAPLFRYFSIRNSFLIVREHVPVLRRWRARRMALRRYRSGLDRFRTGVDADPATARAVALGIEHGVRGRFGPPPAELM